MDIYCPYSKHVKKGFTEYKECTLSNGYCGFIRRCPTRNTVIHTQGVLTCALRKQQRKDD